MNAMNPMPPTCADVRPHLSAYLDQDLEPGHADTIRTHLTTCDTCRGLVADLDRVRDAARHLGPIQPPAHLWLEVAGRLRQETGTSGSTPVTPAIVPPSKTSDGRWQWLGLAAALTLVTLGVYTLGQSDPAIQSAMAETASSNAEEVPTVETVEETMRRAEAEYEKAIAQLEQVLKNENQEVSTSAVETLARNLTTIDSALAETRAALSDNPESRPARVSLFEALRSKVSLLQQTVVLMNEMRKGDAFGAAEAAAGLGSRGIGTV